MFSKHMLVSPVSCSEELRCDGKGRQQLAHSHYGFFTNVAYCNLKFKIVQNMKSCFTAYSEDDSTKSEYFIALYRISNFVFVNVTCPNDVIYFKNLFQHLF